MLERQPSGFLRPAKIPSLLDSSGFGGGGVSTGREILFSGTSFFAPFAYIPGSSEVSLVASGAGASQTPTFTRATTAWTKLSSGLWASVSSGVARSAFIGMNTAPGIYGGYFAEGAGIQLVTPTASIRDMSNAAWVKVTMNVSKNAPGIDGVTDSCSRLSAAGANSTILQTLVAAASSRTYSCWVKRIAGVGTILLKQGTATLDITALINTTSFTQVQLNDNELNVAFGIQINTSGDAIDVDFNQLEAGSFATSPMDAAGAARNADILTYPVAGNISDTAGATYAEITLFAANTSNPRIVGNSASSPTPLFASVGATAIMGFFDSTNNFSTVNTAAVGTPFKGASAWGGATAAVVLKGGTVATGAYDGTHVGAAIGIGYGDSGNQPYGTIKNVRIWPKQLSDAVLQSMTA